MSGILRRLRGAWLVAGVLTAAVGGGFLSNFLFHGSAATSVADPFEAGFLKATAIGATATHGSDSVIMCTGEVDVGIEAVYILDVVTGELKGAALNVRTGKFMTAYAYADIAKDLQADGVKNPKYLMVTGEAQMSQGFGSNGRIGRAVIYVAEVNSGWVACYSVPWAANRATANNQVNAAFQFVDRFPFRQGSIVRPK